MRVVCTDNHGVEKFVTLNVEYEIHHDEDAFYWIQDDEGVERMLLKSRFKPVTKPTTLFTLPDGGTVPIPETLQPLNDDYIVFKGVKYQIVSLTHDVDQGVKIYKMEIVKCK